MSKIAQLKPATSAASSRSPARAALAAAIERVAEVQREIEQTETARARLSEMRFQAERNEAAAKSAIETAKSNSAEYYTAIALGTAGERPLSIKEANAAHTSAIDESESLTNASVSLRDRAVELESEIRSARGRVDDATKKVIADECRPIAQRLVAEYETIARDLAERHAALDWLSYRGVFGVDVRWTPRLLWPDADAAGRTQWRMTADALRADPDAPLPIQSGARV